MRKLLVLPLLLVLTACASLGLPTAKTFNERATVAYSTVKAVRETSETLYLAQKIDVKDLKNVREQLNTARDAIDIAVEVVKTKPVDADAKLASAITILSAVQRYLEEHQ